MVYAFKKCGEWRSLVCFYYDLEKMIEREEYTSPES